MAPSEEKQKQLYFSIVLLLIIIAISIITIFVSPHDPTAQNVKFTNLPPKIPGLNLPGLNGYAMVGGELVDKYAAANVPEGTYYLLGTDGLGRDLLSRLFVGTRISLLIAFIAAFARYHLWRDLWIDFRFIGGRVDNIMQRFLEILSGIPNLVVMIFDAGRLQTRNLFDRSCDGYHQLDSNGSDCSRANNEIKRSRVCASCYDIR